MPALGRSDGDCRASHPIHWKRHGADVFSRPGWALDRHAFVTTQVQRPHSAQLAALIFSARVSQPPTDSLRPSSRERRPRLYSLHPAHVGRMFADSLNLLRWHGTSPHQTCDYRKRPDVMGVTVLLYVRAVNGLFHCPKVLTGDHLRLCSIRYRSWSLEFGPDVDPFILHLFAALGREGAGDDQHSQQGAVGGSQGEWCELRWPEAGPGARGGH